MTTGAIQQDAPASNTEQGQPAQERPNLNDPSVRMSRADAMKLMVQSRRESVASELPPEEAQALLASAAAPAPAGAASDDEDERAAAESDAAVEAERKRLEAAAAADTGNDAGDEARGAADQLAAQASPQVLDEADLDRVQVRRKVNGKEEVVPVRQVLVSAQKNDAADDYLRTAKELLAEARAVAAQQQAAATATAAPATQRQDTTDPAASSTGAQAGDPIDKAIEAVFQGDQAQAARLFAAAIEARTGQGGAAQGPVDVSEIERRIVIRTALRQFAKDHADIAKDATLRRKADEFLFEATGGRALTEFDPDQIPELLDDAGKRTKDWLRSVAGVPAQASPAAQQQPRVELAADRRERKSRIDTLPSASTRSASSVAAPATTSDTIARMAAARNPVANGGRQGSR